MTIGSQLTRPQTQPTNQPINISKKIRNSPNRLNHPGVSTDYPGNGTQLRDVVSSQRCRCSCAYGTLPAYDFQDVGCFVVVSELGCPRRWLTFFWVNQKNKIGKKMSNNIYFCCIFESTSLFSDRWYHPEYVYRRFAIGETTLKTVFCETESEPALPRLFRALEEYLKQF